MDRDNKYYSLIETLVKSHRKFPGYEMILDEIINDVYEHSESVINNIHDENVIKAYIQKVVSTSIITVPKRMNFDNQVKHRSITSIPEPLPSAVQPQNEAPAEEIINEETDLDSSDIIEELAETGDDLILEQDESELPKENEPKANVELVDKMINSIDADSVIETDSLIQENEEDVLTEINSQEDNEEVELEDNEFTSLEEFAVDELEEQTEQIESVSDNIENNEDIEDKQPKEESEELNKIEDVKIDSEEKAVNDLEENLEDAVLFDDNEDAVLDLTSEEELQEDILDEAAEDIVQEVEADESEELSIEEKTENDLVLDDEPDNFIENTEEQDTLELSDEEPNEIEKIEELDEGSSGLYEVAPEENLESGLIDLEDNFGLEEQDVLEESLEPVEEIDSAFELSMQDELLEEAVTDQPEVSDEKVAVLEEALDESNSGYKSFDYSVFSYNPEEQGYTYDEGDIVQKILNIDSENPDMQILKVFDMKYKQNLSIEKIAEELQTDKQYVVAALDKIINII